MVAPRSNNLRPVEKYHYDIFHRTRAKLHWQRHFLQFLSPYYDNAGLKYSEKHLCKTIKPKNTILWFTEYWVAFPPMHRELSGKRLRG